MDPRHWDLKQLLAAYEVTLRQGAKDDAAWQRMRTELYAEPKEVRKERLEAGTGQRSPARAAMTLDSVQHLLDG